MFLRRFTTAAAVLTLLLGIAALTIGSAHPPSDTCSLGTVSRLYLGRSTPTGIVSEGEWRQFVADAVAPRFPAGFTELAAFGHWRDDTGRTLEEPTHILEIAHDETPATRDRVRAIAADYRARFAQQSVLVTQLRSLQCLDSGA